MHKNPLLHSIAAISFGSATGCLFLLILSLLFSVVVYFSPLTEAPLAAMATAADILSLLAAGFVAAQKNGQKGLLTGLLTSAVILLIMLFAGTPETFTAAKAVACCIAGMLGGLLGVR